MAHAPDPLLQLVLEREDEMSPAWRALVGLLRFWLGLFAVVGPIVVVMASMRLMYLLYVHYGGAGLFGYLIAMPLCAAVVVGVERARRGLARKIADAIRARLAGIGGTLTPASFSLGPRKEDP